MMILFYLGFVAVAVGGAFFALKALGLAEPAEVTDADADALLYDVDPSLIVSDRMYADNKILLRVRGGVAIVRAMGRRPTLHFIFSHTLKDMRIKDGQVHLVLSDYGVPKCVLGASDPEALATWIADALAIREV